MFCFFHTHFPHQYASRFAKSNFKNGLAQLNID
jgi:hypothetical protein